MRSAAAFETIVILTIAITVSGCVMTVHPSDSDPAVPSGVSRSSAASWSNERAPSPPAVVLDTKYVQADRRTISVVAGDARDLQSALDRAAAGDTIELQPARYTGNFTLPSKTAAPANEDARWIVIRSAGVDSKLPADVRVGPDAAAVMAKLVTPNADPVLKAAPGAHHFRFVGLEFTATPGVGVGNLIRFGEGDESSLSMLPHDLIIDRCYVHGHPDTKLRRGIALNCARTAIVDSYISDCHEEGADSQAICGWNGPGPFKIVNNYLEGAGENVMFGGADPAIKDLVPSDIEFRKNRCAKPMRWKPGDASYAGRKWSVKNLFELKNARRVLVEGNIFENVWTDAQTGYAVLFKSVNQDGAAPWCVTSDVDFRNNIVRRCGGAINIQGRSEDQPGGRTGRIRIQNNLFEDVGGSQWRGDGAFIKVSDTDCLMIDHNTVSQTGNIITAYGPPTTEFVFTNNSVRHNEYGVKGDGTASGQDTLAKYFPGCVFKKNALLGSRGARYPENNLLIASAEGVGVAPGTFIGNHPAGASPFRSAGTDGRDIGCDFSALTAAVGASNGQTRLVH